MLHAAYNDAQGVTAEFNLNLLRRIRNELDTDLDPTGFTHRAFYNARAGRIEMHLASTVAQQVRVEDRYFQFAAGETIHTENSYKYDLQDFRILAESAGYRTERVWVDKKHLFSVHYLRVVAGWGR